MSATTITEKTSRGVTISKVVLVLSLFLPYVVNWINTEDYYQFSLYAPTWVMLQSDWAVYIGPTPMALLMFVYWVPYVYVAYQAYRFAHGKYSSVARYVAGVAFVTLLAILLIVPLVMVPLAYLGGSYYYPIVVPLPLVSILAVALIPLLRPVELSSPWEQADTVKQNERETLW
ncbi:MAG: hypothetical protein ACFFCP_11095 [Promethearchaeota archaeon]